MAYGDGVKNARIIDTFLGIEDHGIFVMQLTVEQLDGHQAFQRVVSRKNNLVGILGELYRAVGVESWEQLKGKLVRVKVDDGFIRQVGHIIEERWTTDPRYVHDDEE